MSQAKVDRYKEEKRNRKETIRREKRRSLAAKAVGLTIAAAFVAWGGYSAYDAFIGSRPVEPKTYRIDASAIEDFMDGLSSWTDEPEGEAVDEAVETEESVAETEAFEENAAETEETGEAESDAERIEEVTE